MNRKFKKGQLAVIRHDPRIKRELHGHAVVIHKYLGHDTYVVQLLKDDPLLVPGEGPSLLDEFTGVSAKFLDALTGSVTGTRPKLLISR